MKTIIKNKRTGKIDKEFEYHNERNEIILAGKKAADYILNHYGKKIKTSVKAMPEKDTGIVIIVG